MSAAIVPRTWLTQETVDHPLLHRTSCLHVYRMGYSIPSLAGREGDHADDRERASLFGTEGPSKDGTTQERARVPGPVGASILPPSRWYCCYLYDLLVRPSTARAVIAGVKLGPSGVQEPVPRSCVNDPHATRSGRAHRAETAREATGGTPGCRPGGERSPAGLISREPSTTSACSLTERPHGRRRTADRRCRRHRGTEQVPRRTAATPP